MDGPERIDNLADQHSSHENHHHHATGAETGNDRPSALMVELREHIPFSVSAVAIGLIVAGTICTLGYGFGGAGEGDEATHRDQSLKTAELFFHLFHPAHMLFSAAATTAMFCRYDRHVGKAVIIGIVGAIGVCGVSDIVMPHLALLILGAQTPWHVCAYEHPELALPFAAVGVVVGIAAAGGVIRSTIISHSLHVFASTMASIFYMVGPLGIVAWIDDLGKVFLFIIIAVMVPCCLSDIVFPMAMSKSGRELYNREPHQH